MDRDTERGEPAGRDEGEFSLLEFLGVLWRRRLIVAITTGLSVVGVLAYTIVAMLLPPDRSYLPNVYTAKAVILVTERSAGSLQATLLSAGASGLATLAGMAGIAGSYGDIATLIAKSDSTIDELNEEFDFTTRYRVRRSVKAGTRKAVLSRLGVRFESTTSALSISYTDYDPGFAYNVANKLVEILDRRFATLGGNKALKQKDLLEAKIADVEARIRVLEGRIKEFTARHGVLDVEALTSEQVTVMAQLRSELIMRELEIDNYRKFSSIDDPVIRRMQSERDSLQAKLAEMDTGSPGAVLPGQQQLPSLGFEYAGLTRDLAVQTELLKILVQQYELAKMNVQGQDPVFQVLELAQAPDKKSGPSRAAICVVSALGGIIVSMFLAFVVDAIERVRRDPKALQRFRGES